ncbi:MAG: pyrroline-5-carboxylate reductase [Gemmatimonadaceae bacterium]|nr:pyrroline-5-carboxylate reductase [Gemmatimonadaceae bacterium]
MSRNVPSRSPHKSARIVPAAVDQRRAQGRFQTRYPNHRIAVIGAGTMGRSIATGMVRTGAIAAERIAVTDIDTAAARAVAHDLGVVVATDSATACASATVVVICVMPHDVLNILAELVSCGAFASKPLLISVAAKITTPAIEEVVGDRAPVIRAMPNTPCAIGHGMTVLAKGCTATAAHLAVASELFSTLGRCMTLAERHLDAVTALSASGPAFIYLVLEALADGGVRCGLSRDIATELAAQMTLGAAEMVLSTGRHPAALRDDVTTPGGCTIAGLLALEDGRLRSVLARAIEETTRSLAGDSRQGMRTGPSLKAE